jgi:hypothetical protein
MQKLRQALPAAASVLNPVDVLGDALADRYRAALQLVAGDPSVGALIVILTPQFMTQIEETATEMESRRARLEEEALETEYILDKYRFISTLSSESSCFLAVIDRFNSTRPVEIWLKAAETAVDGRRLGVFMTVYAKESETESANAVFDRFTKDMAAEGGIDDIDVRSIDSLSEEDRSIKVVQFTVWVNGSLFGRGE